MNPIERHAMWLLGVMETRGANATVGPDADEVCLDEGGPNTIIHIKGSDSLSEWLNNVGVVTVNNADSIKAAAKQIFDFLHSHFKKNIIVMGFSRGAMIAACLASMLGRDCKLLVACATPGCNDDLIVNAENLRAVPKVIVDRTDCIVRNTIRPAVGNLESYGNVIGNVQYVGTDWNGFRAHTNLIDVTCPELGKRIESAVPHRTLGSTLLPGETMYVGDVLQSGRYKLIQQEDGHLVLYNGGQAIWASLVAGDRDLCFRNQWDGHLVVYNQKGGALGLSHQGRSGSLTLQSDGNLVMYATEGGSPIWHTGTYGGRYSGNWRHGYKC